MSRLILPQPPDELKRLSGQLSSVIHDEWEADGFLPFSRFMELALYAPGLGYYSAGLHKLGPEGDFVTAPELGTLFAGCMAAQVAQIAEALGEYEILELGAGTGRMAVDLLRQLPANRRPKRYSILERSADLAAVQRARVRREIPELAERVTWLEQPPDGPWRGVLIANEVLDALAVERFRVGKHGLEQAGVTASSDGWSWQFREAPAELAKAVTRLSVDLAPGYQSEINLHLAPWLQAVSSTLSHGVALFVDYGYPRREYYAAERRDGTLIANYRHRAHDDVLAWPGLQDLTAFVDFTAVAEAGAAAGLTLAGYTSQAMFLLDCGLDQLLHQVQANSPGGDSLAATKAAAEARQLTLPGMLGERFQVMALVRGQIPHLLGFESLDLTYRL